MRFSRFVALVASTAAASVVQVACSSDNPAGPPADAGGDVDASTFVFNDAQAGTTILIKGAGTVYGGYAAPTGDGGTTSLACTSDGTTTTGDCTAQYQDTLYALAANGYVFSHWEPSLSKSTTFFVDQATPPQITAVFVVNPIAHQDAALPPSPPPADAGHD